MTDATVCIWNVPKGSCVEGFAPHAAMFRGRTQVPEGSDLINRLIQDGYIVRWTIEWCWEL